jgi:peptide/nickel transport system permease protein
MSNLATASLEYPVPLDSTTVVRTYWHQVAHDTFRRTGARIAIVWIALLIFAAVFAPLLANTQPLLVKIDGHWSSPMLQFLSPADVILLILFFAFAIAALFFRKTTVAHRALALLILLAIIIPVCFLFRHPPLTADWQKYRDLDRAGKIQSKIMAPIPYSPNDYQRDNPDAPLNAPTRQHLMGTETNGGDVLSRMLYACRIALSIGLVSTGIAVIIGVTIGGLMGYFSGRVDLIGMRFIEMFEAIPTLFLLITFVAFFGRNLYIMMAIIGVTTWTVEARFIRAEFLRLRKQDFVHAAVASGLPLRSILFRHLLPNGVSPILVTTTFGIASAILYESVLSFLGLGLVEEPSWGQMLNQYNGIGGGFIWWIALYPGLAIFLTVFSYNLLGEALRDALDPKLRT